MSLHANVSGVWKTITEATVRAGGIWKRAEVFVRDNGAWVSVHKNGNIPAGLIVFTDSSTPAGWSTKSSLVGKFLMHSDTYGTTGGSETHSHGSASVGQLQDNASSYNRFHYGHSLGQGLNYDYSAGHSHYVNTHTHGGTGHNPPLIGLRPIEAASQTILPVGSILLIDTTNIPSGFERYGIYDKYIFCSNSPGGIGGSDSHSHEISQNSDSGYNNFRAWHITTTGQSHAYNQYSHSHTVTHSHSGNNDPSAKNYLAIKSLEEMNDAPSGSIGLFSGSIPAGWTKISGTGRLVRLGATDTVGNSFGQSTHSHGHTSFSSGSSPCVPGSAPEPTPLNWPDTHCHTYGDGTYTWYQCGECGCQYHPTQVPQGHICGSLNIGYPGNHSHSISGGTSHDSSDHMPCYITVMLAKKQ